LALILSLLYTFRLSIFKPPFVHFLSWSQVVGQLVVITIAVFLWMG